MKKGVTNNESLRVELIDIFNKLVEGEEDIREARAKIQAAGKVLQSAALQMKYADLNGQKPNIAFFE